MSADDRDPEQTALLRDLRSVLEAAISALPESFRAVLVLCDVEGLSTAETAESLAISEALVKTRLQGAHAALHREMESRIGDALARSFQIQLSRCERVIEAVFRRIRAGEGAAGATED